MPVTKRPEGSYQVTVCYGGRTHRKSSRAWAFADAKEYERRWLASIRDSASGVQPERVIADALEVYLRDYVPRLRSARQTRNHCRQLLPYITGRKLTEIAAVWSEIRGAEQTKRAATINHKGRLLRRIARIAWLELGWLDRPAAISLLPETPRERFLTLAEVNRVAKACKDPRTADYVLLAAYTGIRRGHLLRLTRHDVEGEFLRLDRSGKTQRLQLVPLHKRVRSIAQRLPLGIGDRQLREDWAQARGAAGVACRWHDLRHTCASWLVQAGVPLHTVGEFLGHSSMAVTKRYAHLSPEHLAEAVNRLR